MKILYVTPPWPGFRESVFEGAHEAHGLPSFNRVLFELMLHGHQVDFVILNSAHRPEYIGASLSVRAPWLQGSRIWEVVPTSLTLTGRLRTYRALRKAVAKALDNEEYDFVYAHGSSTGVVRTVAQSRGVPFGQRLYGTFLWAAIQKRPRWLVYSRHFTEWRAFVAPKSFLLVTNDGSRGDLVLNDIWRHRGPPFDFHYVLNGVDLPSTTALPERRPLPKALQGRSFLVQVSRIDSWKRQDKAIRILKSLRDEGHDLALCLAGPIVTQGTDFYEALLALVARFDLGEHVVFTDTIDAPTRDELFRSAIAALSLNDVTNLTNVFHEMLAAGAVCIVQDDGSTSDILENGYSGFLVRDEDEAIDAIRTLLLTSQDQIDAIRDAAKATSLNTMKTWEERALMEIGLIERAVSRHSH